MHKGIFVVALTMSVAACVGAGPRTQAILSDKSGVVFQPEQNTPYAVVGLNDKTAKQASYLLDRWRGVTSFIPDTGTGAVLIGRGDVLDISIVSTSESGFIDLTNSSLSPISTTSLPQQEVGTDGGVSVPPIGRVKARGFSVQRFEETLAERLGDVLVEPSVIVSIAERRSARVSVLGEVANPGTFSINQTNMRLVEMIALAGGPTERAEDLRVSFSRQGTTGRVELNRIYENPRYNIYVQPGDVISIEPPETRLTILGASGENATLKYDDPKLSLADALGRGGGLLNGRADRKGVFIYRQLPVAAAQALGVDVTPFKGEYVPTIFNLDLSRPQAFFAASEFFMDEDDLIYISNSLNDEIIAVTAIFRPYVSPINVQNF